MYDSTQNDARPQVYDQQPAPKSNPPLGLCLLPCFISISQNGSEAHRTGRIRVAHTPTSKYLAPLIQSSELFPGPSQAQMPSGQRKRASFFWLVEFKGTPSKKKEKGHWATGQESSATRQRCLQQGLPPSIIDADILRKVQRAGGCPWEAPSSQFVSGLKILWVLLLILDPCIDSSCQ